MFGAEMEYNSGRSGGGADYYFDNHNKINAVIAESKISALITENRSSVALGSTRPLK
jgi:hypothetical protein